MTSFRRVFFLCCIPFYSQLIILFWQTCGATPNVCPKWTGPRPLDTFDDGSSCYVYITGRETWNMANNICKENGWRLVKIDKDDVQFFIERIVKKASLCCWIGLSDQENEGDYRWTDGSVPTYRDVTNFFILKYFHDCVAVCKVLLSNTFIWKEMRCAYKQDFVCQTDAVPVPRNPVLTNDLQIERKRPAKYFVRQSFNILLQWKPKFSMRGRLAVCSRQCSRSKCAMFNFHPPTRTCNGYLSSDIATQGPEPREGWEVWTELQ